MLNRKEGAWSSWDKVTERVDASVVNAGGDAKLPPIAVQIPDRPEMVPVTQENEMLQGHVAVSNHWDLLGALWQRVATLVFPSLRNLEIGLRKAAVALVFLILGNPLRMVLAAGAV